MACRDPRRERNRVFLDGKGNLAFLGPWYASGGTAGLRATKETAMSDLDNTDLTIHRLIGAWAIKHRVLMTPTALEELERVVLRPVFLQADALLVACNAFRRAESLYGVDARAFDEAFIEASHLADKAIAFIQPDAGAVGE